MDEIRVIVNGTSHGAAPTADRLSTWLRDTAGLRGTKVGCEAGDCGACTVLIDSAPVCSCMVPVGRLDGASVTTVEHLAATESGRRLQASFARHGAAQCGFCTPAMLVTAAALLAEQPHPSADEVVDALGGVLCRCTGYRSIIDAVVAANDDVIERAPPSTDKLVGARVVRVDALPKVQGTDVFGDDAVPADAVTVAVIRSPFHHAAFTIGDLEQYRRDHPSVIGVLTAADVPGRNAFGVIPAYVDQPVFAETHTRHLGEAVAALVVEPGAAGSGHGGSTVEPAVLADFPVTWTELPALLDVGAASQPGAELVHEHRADNVLVRGLVRRGDVDTALADSAHVVTHRFTTRFVEHAYLEPEAGWAWLDNDCVVVEACTQAPQMDREDLMAILDLPAKRVRVIPTAVGGGFGSKLDLSMQPFIALAALTFGRPARLTYTRPESMRTTTKRHPSDITLTAAADDTGLLTAVQLDGVFNTGAYASWGPTVANRVPVHGSGPYLVPNYHAATTAVHTHCVSAGAFRGFGVPQAAIAQECVYDLLADQCGRDRLQFRIDNALRVGQPTVTGQTFDQGVGYADCLEALMPYWRDAHAAIAADGRGGRHRRGVGVAGIWYGCGNTALPNPSTIRCGVTADGQIVLHQGAVDIGQGSNTVMTQIFCQTLGVPIEAVTLVGGDTAITPDAGKTSASRQTFVTGNAVHRAAAALRDRLTASAGAHADAVPDLDAAGRLTAVRLGATVSPLDLTDRPIDAWGYVISAEATYDPPTVALDHDGQGEPYAVYGFGAQLVELDVDTATGRVHLHRIVAAYDVGKAVNPTLVEGQIAGGIAQGIGLALMEEYVPGRSDNLHDYLIPTIGDVPPIVSILVESGDAHGAFGLKGVGEHTLIPTAPAILNAIRDATGALVDDIPATPERVLAAIRRVNGDGGDR